MLPYQTIPQKEDGIAIVGIGGAGANILQCFVGSSASNVRLYTMSLDERVGRACGNYVEFVQLGGGVNHGLGSGGDPSVGSNAALESSKQIQAMLKDTRLLVLVAGLGGGTGSGAAPVLAQMARDAGLFLVSVLVMPFSFEGKRRREQAEAALEEVSRVSDIVFCFENDYMEELFRNRAGARAVFEEVDRILARATASVPMLASSPGFINLGLDELATALENNDSRCIFGCGSGYGANRAEMAAQSVLESPLVAYHGALTFARTVIVHIAGGDSLSLTEIRTVMEKVREGLADEDVRLFFGTTVKPHLGDEIRVTLIASINAEEFKAAIEAPPVPERVPVVESATDEEEADEEEPAAPTSENIYDEEADSELLPEDAPEAELTETEEPEEVETEEDEPTVDSMPELDFGSTSTMHQPELMPTREEPAEESAPPVVEEPRRANSFFSAGGPPGRYPMPGRRKPTDEDDLDTPPTLDFNGLRDFFPRG